MNELFSQGGKGSTGILTNKQAIARKFGVKQSEVVYFSVGVNLYGYKVIYDKENQKAYTLPSDLVAGTVAVSLSDAAVLVHSSGSVDLGELAVQRGEFVSIPYTFVSGATITVKNERLSHFGTLYHWQGALPKVVPPNSSPADTGGFGSNAWSATALDSLKSENIAEGDALITVKQPLADSIARTLHDKNTDLVSVKDFGAKGDGAADDTAAFQRALASKVNLYIPVGIYNISQTLVFSNQVIVGGGIAPLGDRATILNISHNEAAWKYDVTAGYSMGGYLGGFYINYGETKPNNYGGRKGIDIGDTAQLGWPSQCIFENIIIRGAYFGLYDETGSFQMTFRNVMAVECWEGFRKTLGTTILMDTCYSLNSYAGYTLTNVYNLTLNNCALDGANDIQGLTAFTINNCKGVAINGFYTETSETHHNERAFLLVKGDSTVSINGFAVASHTVKLTAGEAYFIRVNDTSRVSISGMFFNEVTSTALYMYPIMATGSARVKVETTALKQWVGSTAGASLAALGDSLIEYDNTVFNPTTTVGWCSNNGVVAKGSLAVSTTLAAGADLAAGTINFSGDYKPVKGDYLIHGTNFNVQSCAIILQPTGENTCSVYIKNLSAGGSVTITGIIYASAIRRS